MRSKGSSTTAQKNNQDFLEFSVQIIGSGSATPRADRRFPAQILTIGEELILIDCGEGTQHALMAAGIKTSKIQHIFISHLHADHCMGLFGLISTMNLHDRKKPLSVHGPSGLADIILTLAKHSLTVWKFPFQIKEHATHESGVVVECSQWKVKTVPLYHKLPCTGYHFEEVSARLKIDPNKLPKGIPPSLIGLLSKGETVLLPDGRSLSPEEVALPALPPRSYAYCSDTDFNRAIVPFIRNTGTLYHESTFLSDLSHKARETKHSTAAEAATIASEAKVGCLVLGHYSGRYENIQAFQAEAASVFPATIAGYDGLKVDILYSTLD